MRVYEKPSVTIQRQGFADFLKGLAVLCMIQVHITELLLHQSFSYSPAGVFSLFWGGPPAAPVFLAAMGYFFAASRKPAKTKYLRGVLLFAGGIVLNIILNASLLLQVSRGVIHVNPLNYILGVDILLLAGISLLVLTLLDKMLRISFVVPLIVGFIAVAAGVLLRELFGTGSGAWSYLYALLFSEADWSYFPLLPWVAYPLFGFGYYEFRKQQPQWNNVLHKKALPVFLAAAVILLAFLPQAVAISADLPGYYHHGVFFSVWVLLFLAVYSVMVYYLYTRIRQMRAANYICWIGKKVTAFYIVQWALIGNTATWFYRTIPAAFLPLLFLIIMLLCSVFVWFWEKKLKNLMSTLWDYMLQAG